MIEWNLLHRASFFFFNNLNNKVNISVFLYFWKKRANALNHHFLSVCTNRFTIIISIIFKKCYECIKRNYFPFNAFHSNNHSLINTFFFNCFTITTGYNRNKCQCLPFNLFCECFSNNSKRFKKY